MGASFVDQIPVNIGTLDEFQSIAAFLREAQFDEATICRTLNLKDMSAVGAVKEARANLKEISPQLQVLIRLFLSVSLVPRADVERALDAAVLEAFLSLGLLGDSEFGDDEYYARAMLYPVAGFWIASDRHSLPDRSDFKPSPDIVFPAIYSGTLRFLGLLPRNDSCEALDLCAGTGIGALVLSRHSKHAVSADITERASQFALFNRKLNNRENVEVVRGDLYEAVDGRMFDLIVAHPPYVPSVGLNTIWRDGGATGELLVQKIVQGLPRHLRRGGIFCCLTQGVDTEDGHFEERARSWLEEAGDEFDIVFSWDKERTPQQVLEIISGKGTFVGDSRIQELQTEFERAKIVKLPYGALFIRRGGDGPSVKPWTARKKLSEHTSGADVEATFALHDLMVEPTFAESLANASPRLAPHLEVKVTHVVHEGSLVPAEYIFETDKPFSLRVRFDDWMVPMMIRFDGKSTVADVYKDARDESEMPENFKLDDFLVLVSRALEGGLLLLDG